MLQGSGYYRICGHTLIDIALLVPAVYLLVTELSFERWKKVSQFPLAFFLFFSYSPSYY